MPTLNQVKNACNLVFDRTLSLLSARQSNYFVNRARYWQGLKTHSVTPSHTTSTWGRLDPDRLNANPTDEFDSWTAAVPDLDSVQLPCALTVDTYDGPMGKGYILRAEFIYNNALYVRATNIGPLIEETTDWITG
jgi:hypothetical protein